MSFYVTLPSNGADLTSDEGKRNNTQTEFTIKLNKTIEFNKPYEVALVESWFSLNWKVNVANIKVFLKKMFLFETNIESFDGVSIKSMMNITSNTLQSDLSKFFLNLTLEKKEEISRQFGNTEVNNNAIDLFLNKISTITIDSDNEDHFTITLPKFFRLEISGFLTNFMTNHSTLFKISTGVAIKDPNFKNKIELIEDQIIIEGEDSLIYNFFVRQTRFNFLQELYLYTDIIEYQYIGSQMARLLRVVTVDNKKDSLIHLSYLDPHYLTVNKNRLDSILLKLTDERGEPVKFSDSTSRVIYKLHFRPINKT